MVDKIALAVGAFVTIFLLFIQQDSQNVPAIIYLNCFKVGAIVFFVIWVPGKILTAGSRAGR